MRIGVHSRVTTVAILVGASFSYAQPPRGGERGAPPPPAASAPRPAESTGTPAPPSASTVLADHLSTTKHTTRLGGTDIAYTAVAGTIALPNATATKARGHMFFVAYTKDGENAATRPITFVYNGGPGSATVWLHMGLVGPKRIQMASEGFQPNPPYKLVENGESILDITDIVAVDAMSTGFSRPAEGEDVKQFHGARQDIETFGEFIRMYLTRFQRWASPKYLLGESYGTIRSAGLSFELQSRHGIELNGITLLSALLTYQTLTEQTGNDIHYAAFLPTYTADAWYHKRLPADLQAKGIHELAMEAKDFSLGPYLSALVKGSRLRGAERDAMVAQVARYTGLDRQFVSDANLRVNPSRFRKELLRDKRLSIGRLDGRFVGVDKDAAGESQEFDPSNTALQGAYTALFLDYARKELGWTSDLRYSTSGGVQPWDYTAYSNRYFSFADELRQTMSRNPALKVFVASGYYDSATPFAGMEHNVDHLSYEPAIRDRVSFGYYEGGHMMYIHPQEIKDLKADLVKFYRDSSGASTR